MGLEESNKISLSLIASGIISWFLGRKLNQPVLVLDPETQKEVLHKPYHSLFFIPMEYAGVILALIGIGILITR
jgi:hypothetical protein